MPHQCGKILNPSSLWKDIQCLINVERYSMPHQCGKIINAQCGKIVLPELLLLDVADNKLIIGAAVTMTTLEIYLEKLCKTSSGTCITLENLGNNILMINILIQFNKVEQNSIDKTFD
jgi:hypothetical protein